MHDKRSRGRRGTGARALGWLALSVVLIAASGTAEAAPKISFGPKLPLDFQRDTGFSAGDLPGKQQFGYFEVRNTGTTKLKVTRLEITGPDAAIMAFNGDFDPFCGSGQVCAQGFTLQAGQARSFQTVCTPTQPGVFSASLVVTGNVAHHQVSAEMVCLGLHPPVITVSPNGLDFGIAHFCFRGDSCGPSCATAPGTQSLTITNSAPAPSELEFYFAGNVPTGPFGDVTITPADQATEPRNSVVLRAGDSATFQFSFHASTGADITGPLELVSVFPVQPPVAIPFQARIGSGQVVIDPPDFPSPVAYGQSFTRTITGHNSGNSCLSITEFSSSGMCQPIDGWSSELVQPGESFSRTFTCTVNAENQGATEIQLECPFEGLDHQFFHFSVEPSGGALFSFSEAIEFTGANEVAIGSSATLPVEIYNFGVNPTDLVTLTSTDSQLTAAPAAGSLPVTIGAGEATLIDVTFTPTTAGRTTGTLTFGVSLGLGLALPMLGDGVIGVAGQTSSSPRAEPATTGGCQTADAGGLAPVAGLTALAALLGRRRRRAR